MFIESVSFHNLLSSLFLHSGLPRLAEGKDRAQADLQAGRIAKRRNCGRIWLDSGDDRYRDDGISIRICHEDERDVESSNE